VPPLLGNLTPIRSLSLFTASLGFLRRTLGAVVDIITIVAVQILKLSVEGSPRNGEQGSVNVALERVSQSGPAAAVLYILALAALYKLTNKYTALLVVISGAIAGQFIFV